MAEQYGLFAATSGIAAVYFSQPHTQVVVVGQGDAAEQLRQAAAAPFAFNKTVIALSPNQVVAKNLPPALAETIPHLPASRSQEAVAVLCSGMVCQPPVSDPSRLAHALGQALRIQAA